MKQKGAARISKLRQRDMFWGYLFIAPMLIGLLIFYIIPVFQTFYYSFTDWGSFGNYSWSGLDNFREMLDDPSIFASFRNTVLYAIFMVPVSIAISIIVAVLLNQKIKGLTVYRTLYFLPVVTMPAAVGMIWKWLYDADYGIINHFLSIFSIEGPHWLTDPNWALISIIIVGVWSIIGTNMVILLSGLQGIPGMLYEAAELDGAGPFYTFFHITLPMLTPTIFFVTVTTSIQAFQVFDFIFMMVDQTNPAINSVQSVIYLFYEYAFVMDNKGIGAAIAFVLFIIVLILTVVQFKLQKKWVNY